MVRIVLTSNYFGGCVSGFDTPTPYNRRGLGWPSFIKAQHSLQAPSQGVRIGPIRRYTGFHRS